MTDRVGVAMKNVSVSVVVALVVCVPVGALCQRSDSEHDVAIQALASRPKISQALELVRDFESEAEATLIELTEIPAPPFGEAERGQKFVALLREAGLGDPSPLGCRA